MNNQVLRAIDSIKFVSNKSSCITKMFGYLADYGASIYNYQWLENIITELRTDLETRNLVIFTLNWLS